MEDTSNQTITALLQLTQRFDTLQKASSRRMLVRARANPRQSPRLQSPASQRGQGDAVLGHTDRGGSHARVPACIGNTGAAKSRHRLAGRETISAALQEGQVPSASIRAEADRMSDSEDEPMQYDGIITEKSCARSPMNFKKILIFACHPPYNIIRILRTQI